MNRFFVQKIAVLFFLLSSILLPTRARANELAFDKLTLSEEFHSEGIAVADIDKDGHPDVVSGPFWYRGPDFRKAIQYAPGSGNSLSIKGYSLHFFTWTHDLDGDGFVDILTVGMPGDAAYWFKNPGKNHVQSPVWKKQKAFDDISNESPAFQDIDGDGKPEIVCIHQGAYSYISYSMVDGQVKFQRTPITQNLRYGRFTHGMGIGDIDGDGKKDLLETNGWWRQLKRGELFKFHPFRFAQSGGAQMYAYDFDGDGDNDVICSQNAHGFGLKWFEQVRSENKIDFVPRTIMTDQPKDNTFGLAISQMHAAGLYDMDGDGIKDLVTGKRYWAHGGADPGSKQLPVLFWLKTVRKNGRVEFVPQLIDARSGVGTQVHISDINKDGQPDLAIGNKLGTYVFLQNEKSPSKRWEDLPLAAGTQLFYENVRTTEPLTPAQQQQTFVLPPGFEIQLVAAEPDIAKPMNMAFDNRGRLWVSSSEEYPYAAKGGAKPKDTIKILEDTDGDGRADIVKTFADGMNIPMGILPYGEGCICFSIPNIYYLRDTDGDDRADKREILFGPFDTSRDTHGMCSSFNLGHDGWVYACHGFNNQSKVKGKDGHEVSMQSGHVFRFRPDGSRIEIVSRGQVNPFGMTIDSRGDIFTADCHTKPINLVLPGGHHDSFGKPHDGLGYIPNVMEHLHDSTGIGGIALGEFTNFPDVYQQSTFGGNVVTGRVNRNHLLYKGSSMNAREESDFVIPGDPWFRPVNLQVGPDGALYIADFYNRIIGHYEVDLDHPGRDRKRGRIWKVVFTGDPGRRDKVQPSLPYERLTKDNLLQMTAKIVSPNKIQSRLIVDAAIQKFWRDQQFATEFLDKLRRMPDTNGEALYWTAVIFKALGLHGPPAQKALLQNSNAKIRCLGFQFLREFKTTDFQQKAIAQMLNRGLRDESLFVQRFAAIASASHPSVDVTDGLVNALKIGIQANDRYLVHALKIALREQFKAHTNRMERAIAILDPATRQAFADICLAVKSPASAAFIVANLESLATQNPGKLTAYLEFAAKHADEQSIDSIVQIAKNRFANDQDFQLEILQSLRIGIQQKGRAMPESMRRLSSQIAESLMGLQARNWAVRGNHKNTAFTTRILTIEDRQRGAKNQGAKNGRFIDTLARGESMTGVLRSIPILLTRQFEFHLAGHDSGGSGDQKMNFVRLILLEDVNAKNRSKKDKVKNGTIIGQVRVPANDVANKVVIDTTKHEGLTAVVEIVDNCDAKSFAWIAAGLFQSHPQLNPGPSWSVDPETESLSWKCFQDETALTPAADNIFVMSRRRDSKDGMKETPLWSSIVKGEQRTGAYRSESFELENAFSFYLAGHDGYPDKPLNQLNYVQLRLADTGQVIRKVSPPRNDTAHKIDWDTKTWSGQKAYVELVDQDDAGAFAWLAAGRFSISGLNPAPKQGDRKMAAQIIGDFRLQRLKPQVLQLLDGTKSLQLKTELCSCLLQLHRQKISSQSVFEVAANLISSGKKDREIEALCISSITSLNVNNARQAILISSKKMSVAEQGRMAIRLAGDLPSAKFLVDSIDQGVFARDILRDPGLVAKLSGYSGWQMDTRVAKLVSQIPKVDSKLLETIANRKASYSSSKKDLANGKLVFEKNCANCHQMAGQGKQVGPNLDGIGSRGLDRLIDDILLPNRNVDAAFRASIVATIDGKVLSGFVKKGSDDDTHLTLVDNQGKETTIPKADIENQKETNNSPMPANFAQTLSEREFHDLIGFLLSNRN